MRSAYITGLTPEELDKLRKDLWNTQKKKCFICDDEIDLNLQTHDIDHIKPLASGGKDDLTNFGLTHDSCNRSKQVSDLQVARVLAWFEKLRDKCKKNNRIPNLDDVLQEKTKKRYEISLGMDDGHVKYCFSESGDNKVHKSELFTDVKSNFKSFYAEIPIEYLFHDNKINPRPISGHLGGLVEEFHKGFPQLQIAIGWIMPDKNNSGKIYVFDGQHKAVAQVLLGAKKLPIRIFQLAPSTTTEDLRKLLDANLHAGTTLKQVAFDKSIQRNLQGSVYGERVKEYQLGHALEDDNFSFSERDLVNYFKGESREMKKYVLGHQRDDITKDRENKLANYVEFGGRGHEKPFSYSTIEKTFYSLFIYQDLLQTPLDDIKNPRELEQRQISKLMSIIAEEIFIGKFEYGLGTTRIEHKIVKKETLPIDHIIAYRLSREEISHAWLEVLRTAITSFFTQHEGKFPQEKKLFQYEFPPQLWTNIRNFIRNLRELPIWKNLSLAQTVFGGRQSTDYWRSILSTGNTPDGQLVMTEPLNLNKMIIE